MNTKNMTNVPLIAQLVERWTVDKIQKSIGRWFKSGSEDILIENFDFLTDIISCIPEDEGYDLQVCLFQHFMTAALSNLRNICNVIVAFENFMALQVYLQQLLVKMSHLEIS
ncbi:hypothetical protein T07_10898 [Trichinella nelsoni]|uniref:Uncharacterized protein n=1 Tax=Trichinella nelsoni TaxID=6336 RepID=A0A0V0SP79_9BILA|nr:hypothetical protein T07_10898 [Trichinella nelsoni]